MSGANLPRLAQTKKTRSRYTAAYHYPCDCDTKVAKSAEMGEKGYTVFAFCRGGIWWWDDVVIR
jgi:predicted SprT family Zn-dependent metalloprotease